MWCARCCRPFPRPVCADAMVKRWLKFVAVWICCVVFYLLYREWFSYLLLTAVTALPLLSLVLSLPAILLARLRIELPPVVARGTHIKVHVSLDTKIPLPQWRMRMIGRHLLWGKDWVLRAYGDFPTEHCGTVTCKCARYWIYDYLGLFCLPKRGPAAFAVSVRPVPEMPVPAPNVDEYMSKSWRPKAGGGFSEHHELRLYRPGDHLKQIHWKLSAKTGELIFREAMIPQGGRMLLWLHHSGTPEELDRKLGRLVWTSNFLRRMGLQHDVLAYTGEGPRIWHIGTEHTMVDVLDLLLLTPPAETDGEQALSGISAAWQFYIGGDAYEKN